MVESQTSVRWPRSREKGADILKKEHRRSFKLINSKTYPVSGGEFNPANVAEEIEHLAQLGVKKGLVYDDALYLGKLMRLKCAKSLCIKP